MCSAKIMFRRYESFRLVSSTGQIELKGEKCIFIFPLGSRKLGLGTRLVSDTLLPCQYRGTSEPVWLVYLVSLDLAQHHPQGVVEL